MLRRFVLRECVKRRHGSGQIHEVMHVTVGGGTDDTNSEHSDLFGYVPRSYGSIYNLIVA